MDRRGVIVTDGNERSTLAVTRSLGRQGIPVYVGAETTSSLAGVSRFSANSFTYPSPWTDPVGYLASVLAAASRWNVAAVFPITDIAVEVIGEQQSNPEHSFVLPMPTLDQYHQISDKYRLTAWAQEQGIPTPRTLFVPDGRLEGLIEQINEWPVVVKPGASLLKMDGLWRKSAVQFARDADDLRRMYHEAWFLQHPSMIQEVVAGNGEGVFGIFEEGHPKSLFAHRRLRERPPSGGVSVLREAISLPEPMTQYAMRILRHASWNGAAMVEFKVDSRSGVPYLMEVNGRFWGSLQLAIDAGVDFPFQLYCKATGEIAPSVEGYQVGTRSQWWLGEVDHLLARLREPRKLRLQSNSSSTWKVVLDLVNILDSQVKNEVFRSSDLAPGFLELQRYLLGTVRAVRRKLGGLLQRWIKKGWIAGADLRLRTGLHRRALTDRFPRDAKEILVLCKGNICRSPFADRYLIRASLQRGLDLKVSSAGLDAENGQTAYPLAISVSKSFGVDLNHHRTRALTKELVENADVVLVMDPAQRQQLVGRFPKLRDKTYLLGHFSREHPATEIADPYGGSVSEFAQCYDLITSACDGLLDHL